MALQHEQAELAEQWPDRYAWAYVDVARRQLSVLTQRLRSGVMRPSARDTAHLRASLDDVDLQLTLLRQLVAESSSAQSKT